MKSKKVLTISILPIMWLIYVLFELISGRISDIKTLLFNLILIILFGLVGLIIYNFSIKFRSGLNNGPAGPAAAGDIGIPKANNDIIMPDR